MGTAFEGMASKEAYACFKDLLRCNGVADVASGAFKLVQLLQLGKLEKGSLDTSAKYNSRNGRWFNQRDGSGRVGDGNGDEGAGDGVHIMRDSLIQLKCKRGKYESVEYYSDYRVLAFFTKYYNKWFVSDETRFPWMEEEHKVATVCV